MTDHLFALPLDVGRYMFVLCSSVYDSPFLAFLSHFLENTPVLVLALLYIFTVLSNAYFITELFYKC